MDGFAPGPSYTFSHISQNKNGCVRTLVIPSFVIHVNDEKWSSKSYRYYNTGERLNVMEQNCGPGKIKEAKRS